MKYRVHCLRALVLALTACTDLPLDSFRVTRDATVDAQADAAPVDAASVDATPIDAAAVDTHPPPSCPSYLDSTNKPWWLAPKGEPLPAECRDKTGFTLEVCQGLAAAYAAEDVDDQGCSSTVPFIAQGHPCHPGYENPPEFPQDVPRWSCWTLPQPEFDTGLPLVRFVSSCNPCLSAGADK